MHNPARLVVLISGTGRNLQAILDAVQRQQIPAIVAAVISNNPEAKGLAHARAAAIPVAVINHRDYAGRADFEKALSAEIDRHAPDFIALAGFMRILGSEFVQRYRGRLLNIHPSLLPKYPGLQTHARALADQEGWHGASVHFVTDAVDGGPIILQGRVAVQANDTVASLSDRVMNEIETLIYPQVLAWACSGRLEMKNEQLVLDGQVLKTPLQTETRTKELDHG